MFGAFYNMTKLDSSKLTIMPGMVAHTCNPSYSGSRDQEDPGLKPAQANIS
jgi:hypothetical protein